MERKNDALTPLYARLLLRLTRPFPNLRHGVHQAVARKGNTVNASPGGRSCARCRLRDGRQLPVLGGCGRSHGRGPRHRNQPGNGRQRPTSHRDESMDQCSCRAGTGTDGTAGRIIRRSDHVRCAGCLRLPGSTRTHPASLACRCADCPVRSEEDEWNRGQNC